MLLSLLMNSRDAQAGENLAPKADASRLLSALKELANLRDDADSFERFARRWPVFADVVDDRQFDQSHPSDSEEFRAEHGYYPMIFGGYAYGEPMTSMPPSIPKKFFLTWQMREALREIWRGNSKKLRDVLIDVMVQSLDELIGDKDSEVGSPPQLKLDWHRGEFVYTPQNEFQGAVYQLFRRSALVKVCANPDCPAPYFIADKIAQRYCQDACAQVFQREWKRRWWKEKGTKWRRKKSRGKRGKR